MLSTAILVGLGFTSGMGERTPAPEVGLRLESAVVRVEADWSGADKIESGAGYAARGAVDLRHRWVFAGVGYTYRDGGVWVKRASWLRAGVDLGPLSVIARAAVDSPNRERGVELRARTHVGRLLVETRVFAARHAQGTGYGSALLVGIGH